MYIENLELKNFRNYETLTLDLDQKTNIFFGNNAQGKTNILEAVYLCGSTRSHRGSRDKDMIRFGEEEAHICMHVTRDTMKYRIDMHLKKNKTKGIAINEIPIRKASELFGIVNFVFFSPEDLNIVKNGPAERRRFMNFEICQTDRIYMDDLAKYQKTLDQRNALLRDVYIRPDYQDMLDVWDSQLSFFGKKIIRRRKEFISYLRELTSSIHSELTDGLEQIDLQYEPDTDEESFDEDLISAREKDLHLKTTSVGPHRDDFSIVVGGIDIRRFGSQGQQRTAALSLKLAEIGILKKLTGETPILLLDDVLSELDRNRQNDLLKKIGDIQTLITCTGIDDFVHHHFDMNRTFKVTNGTVEEYRQEE